MKVTRFVLLATLILGGAMPAAAQVSAHASIGYANGSKAFDNDGKRQDLGGSGSELTINLGGVYRFFKGLGAGVDLGIAQVTRKSDAAGSTEQSSFGLRNLLIGLVWNTVAGESGELDAALGFAIDLGKKDADFGSKDTATSDRQHAIMARLAYSHQMHSAVRAHIAIGLAVPLERTEDGKNGGTGTKHDNGLVIDPSIGVAYNHPGGFMAGLDIGFFNQSHTAKNEKGDDVGSYVLYATPWVGWALGPQQNVRLMFAEHGEYANIGFAIIGQNAPIPLVPITLAWHGSF